MLIAELISLIAIEPVSGATEPRLKLLHHPKILIAALLMELAAQLRIGLNKGQVVVLDQLPSRHPLLTQALRQLAPISGQLDTATVLNKLVASIPHVRDELLEGLVRRDILHNGTHKYKFFGEKRFPLRSKQAQSEGFQVLHRSAIGEETSMTALGMLSVAVASGVLDRLLPFEESEAAKARLRELREEINAELEAARVTQSKSEDLDELYAIALMSELEIQVKLVANAAGNLPGTSKNPSMGF